MKGKKGFCVSRLRRYRHSNPGTPSGVFRIAVGTGTSGMVGLRCDGPLCGFLWQISCAHQHVDKHRRRGRGRGSTRARGQAECTRAPQGLMLKQRVNRSALDPALYTGDPRAIDQPSRTVEGAPLSATSFETSLPACRIYSTTTL